MTLPIENYISKAYFKNNPSWDMQDSPWKAEFAGRLLITHNITPASVCDVGCGAGGVLVHLRHKYPDAVLRGYDIAPDVASFWPRYAHERIDFVSGDFLSLDTTTYDVILLLDVIEHLADPFSFLSAISEKAKYFIFHIPLDLSAINVLREKPILDARKNTFHIHYFTKNLALALLGESGFKIIEWKYSGSALRGPRCSLKSKLASIPRRIGYMINQEIGVRALGGETLFVLAEGKR